MSDLKFACPVCGQHITADSSFSGGKLECPTCFRKIIIPQAPTSADTKFILSASEADRPRPPMPEALAPRGPSPTRPGSRPMALVLATTAVMLGCAVGAAVLWGVISKPNPKRVKWKSDLRTTALPSHAVIGRIHGGIFVCNRALLQGGNLTLSQGTNWAVASEITLRLPVRQGEELSGRTIEVTADQRPPIPQVTLAYAKQGQPGTARQDFNRGGYAMKLVFGQAANGRLPGRIYICLPDPEKSVVAGAFEAEIRRPGPVWRQPWGTPGG
jgi:hypothetical protein